MLVKICLITLSLMTISAYPLHRNVRETLWEVSTENQVHDKAQLTKDMDNTYKTHIDSSDLYRQDSDGSKSPVAEEMHRKLHVESERLRGRLRQELAELRERLASSSSRLDSFLASVRARLAPLAQQLQSSLSSHTDGLCGRLRHHLQGLDGAQVQAEASSSVYQEVEHLMSQTLQQSSSNLAGILDEFQMKTTETIHQLRENSEGEATGAELWQEFSLRLQQKLSSVKMEAEIRAEVLKTQLGAGLPVKTEAEGRVEDFCHAASRQSHALPGQIDSLFMGLGEAIMDSNLPPFSEHPSGSLQEDFSQKFSALIQDILHSVQ